MKGKMAVPTFEPKKNSNLTSILIYVFSVIGVGLLVFFGARTLKDFKGFGSKAALTVEVLSGEAEVLLDGEYLGKVPFTSQEISTGEHKLTVKGIDTGFEITLPFTANSEVALNRDLGVSNTFSSGQNFWLEKSDSSTVLSVISEPTGAKVFVDNTQLGTAPYSTNTLSEGEYDLRLEFPGYETQTARIKIMKDFKLNVVAKLFPVPVPSRVGLLEGSESLYDIATNEAVVSSNPMEWVKAIVYWNKTRGINVGDTGVNKELVFDYFIDYSGRIYDRDGNDVTANASEALQDVTRGAYLRRISDGAGITDAAKTALESLNVVAGKTATINSTPTGWLNVRSSAGLDAEVITQVNVGETYTVVEEATGWVKIKVSDTVDGWVYSQYVTVTE